MYQEEDRSQLTNLFCVPFFKLHATKVVPWTRRKVHQLESQILGEDGQLVRTIPYTPRILSWAIRHRACGRDNGALTPYWSSEVSYSLVLVGLCLHFPCFPHLRASTLGLVVGGTMPGTYCRRGEEEGEKCAAKWISVLCAERPSFLTVCVTAYHGRASNPVGVASTSCIAPS